MSSPRHLRICQVSAAYYPYPSGVTELVHHLSQALRDLGHSVRILTTSYGPGTREMPDVTRIGRALFIPMNKSFATVPFDWNMSGQVKRFLRRNEFDILHLHGFFPPDIAYYALVHSRSVNVVSFLTVGFRDYGFAARLWRGLSKQYNRKMHGRVALTQGALQFIAPYFPGEFRVIPPGVDLARFHPAEPFPGPRPPTVLFVGRLDRRKGLAVLLNAMPIVKREVPQARLVVVGKGPMETESRRLVEQLGLTDAVEFHGFAANDDLPAFYTRADVYCSPALGGEAFGIVLIEAMACGTTVVASDITGYNEVVRHEENGLLFPAGDSALLARSLVRLLQDSELRARLRASGLARAQSLSWPNIALQFDGYYHELLTRFGPAQSRR